MQPGTYPATATINNGEPATATLIVEQDIRTETTNLPRPDPRWKHTDPNGHVHTYTTGGELPTLRPEAEHRDCDGSCGGVCGGEGYTVTRWYCRACGVEVEPGMIPGPHTFTVPGMLSWRAQVHAYADPAGQVMVKFQIGDEEVHGVAYVAEARAEAGSGSSVRVTTDLIGTGPLDARPWGHGYATPPHRC